MRAGAASSIEQKPSGSAPLLFSSKLPERLLFAIGATLVLVYAGGTAYRSAASRRAVQAFEEAKSAPETVARTQPVELPSAEVDIRLWGTKRIAAYRASLERQFSPPIAVLRAPKLGVEVPVFDGTDELALNRGVGRIAGTARPGRPGNLGIAGHRDGFFRALKDIAVGDPVTLDIGATVEAYVVESITIVARNDVSVLRPTPVPSLTLVTCYPFYFLGDAPKRYIVRCVLADHRERGGAPRAAPQGSGGNL
jgi:sortase A